MEKCPWILIYLLKLKRTRGGGGGYYKINKTVKNKNPTYSTFFLIYQIAIFKRHCKLILNKLIQYAYQNV